MTEHDYESTVWHECIECRRVFDANMELVGHSDVIYIGIGLSLIDKHLQNERLRRYDTAATIETINIQLKTIETRLSWPLYNFDYPTFMLDAFIVGLIEYHNKYSDQSIAVLQKGFIRRYDISPKLEKALINYNRKMDKEKKRIEKIKRSVKDDRDRNYHPDNYNYRPDDDTNNI